MKKIMLGAILCCTFCGCTNLPRTINALKNDQATVSASVTTIYGTIKFVRTNPQTHSTVTVTPDGTVTVKTP